MPSRGPRKWNSKKPRKKRSLHCLHREVWFDWLRHNSLFCQKLTSKVSAIGHRPAFRPLAPHVSSSLAQSFLKYRGRHNRYDRRGTIGINVTVSPTMWLPLVSHWLLAASLLSQAAPAAPPLPELIPTRQARFAIPFRVEPSDEPSRQAAEVELHVSSDRGEHWRFYAKEPASGQHFVFRANVDGEYWFAIRTINRAGQATPAAITAPGLRVLVNTKPPSLKLTAQPAPDGQISLRWEIDERNPKPNSLRLAYRPASSDTWRPVNAAPQVVSRAGSREIGRVLFRPEPRANDIECRAEVSDTAGNVTVAYAQVKLAPIEPSKPDERPSGQPPKAPKGPSDRLPPGTPRPADARVPLAKPVPPATAEPKGSVAIAINPPVGTNTRPPAGRPWRAPRRRKFRRANAREWSIPDCSTRIRRGFRWPLGHRPRGALGNNRRRQDLAPLPGGQRQTEIALGERRRGGHLRFPHGGDQRRRAGRATARGRRSARHLDRRGPDEAHRTDRLGPARR